MPGKRPELGETPLIHHTAGYILNMKKPVIQNWSMSSALEAGAERHNKHTCVGTGGGRVNMQTVAHTVGFSVGFHNAWLCALVSFKTSINFECSYVPHWVLS